MYLDISRHRIQLSFQSLSNDDVRVGIYALPSTRKLENLIDVSHAFQISLKINSSTVYASPIYPTPATQLQAALAKVFKHLHKAKEEKYHDLKTDGSR